MRISLRQILVLAALAASPAVAFAQGGAAVRVSAPRAELHASPDGARVATLLRGTALTPGARNGAWREVTVEGWIPARAVAPAGSGGRVAVREGATLHTAPDGASVATAAAGMVLREVERRGAWVRVRRTGWVRADGLGAAPPTSSQPAAAKPAPAASPPRSESAASRPVRDTASRAATRATPATPPARPAGTTPPAATPPAVTRPAPAPTPGRDAVVLHAAPGADGRVAVVDADAPVQVLARQGEWTRVRVEGWTRAPVAGQPTSAAAPARPVTLAALRADPDAFVGRQVEWTLRFVSVQVADSVRTDFRPGETFLLTRDPDGETGYVYVAVTPQQAAAARRFTPLQPFRISARVRVPRSPLMGHPIVELIRFR